MRPPYYYILFLFCFFSWPIYSTDGDRLHLESEDGMKKGTIFFAPETDLSYHKIATESKEISGTEIYTSWGTIEKAEGVYDWSYIDDLILRYQAVGKKVALRIATTNFSINDAPAYLYNQYNVRRIVSGYWENFEKGDKGYVIHAEKTTNALSGTYSIQQKSAVKRAMIETGGTQIFDVKTGILNPSFQPRLPVHSYKTPAFCVQFDFKANEKTTFYAKAYSRTLGNQGVFYQEWTANAAQTGSRTMEFSPLKNCTDYKVEIGILSGDLTLDNVTICDMKTNYYVGTLCYPNYFDPIFKEKYEVFVRALAQRYKDQPTLNSICVGGFGRWEEITLSDDVEAYRFEDQWTTYGFTNQKYIEHIKWCIDLYKKYFTTKKVFMGVVGWSTDSFRDQVLIDWKIGNYAASKGVSIKYNGWQSMCGDWGQETTAFFYQINRYKYDPNVFTIFEEGGQINNHGLTEIMGHPISLYNRAIIDGIDYYWMYQNDLEDPFVSQFRHYANEMAGNGLFTKLYNHFGTYSYFSPQSRKTSQLRNIWLGVFQNDDTYQTKWTYTSINGERAVQTNATNHRISMNIDDRQKYNGMYGAQVTIDYLDNGTDAFKVYGNSPKESLELAKIQKTNTGKWKTISFLDNGFTTKCENGGRDFPNELEIDDCGDGIETLRSLEIDFVPAREWQEKVVESNALSNQKSTPIGDSFVMEIPVNKWEAVSSIALNVSPITNEYVNILAIVSAKIDGQYQLLTTKNYFMPEPLDWFYIPVATQPNVEAYKIELKMEKGNAAIQLGADNKAAYRLYQYINETATEMNAEIEAVKPFNELRFISNDKILILNRKLADGNWQKLKELQSDATGHVFFEPQTAGRYQLLDEKGRSISASPAYLQRLSVPTKPMRNLQGTLLNDFSRKNPFRVVSGLKNIQNDTLGFHATVSAENPTLLCNSLNIPANKENQLHFVLKNETNSSLSKVYWSTGKGDFSEENSTILPIVPNDSEYREYCYPIGMHVGWKDKITAIKILPVFGHTDVGKISIFCIDLRLGNNTLNTFTDKLVLTKSNFRITE